MDIKEKTPKEVANIIFKIVSDVNKKFPITKEMEKLDSIDERRILRESITNRRISYINEVCCKKNISNKHVLKIMCFNKL
jgi:hypothetical protein